MKSTNVKFYGYIFSFLLIASMASLYLYIDKNFQIKELNKKSMQKDTHMISSILQQYEKSVELIFNTMVNKDEILELQNKALETESSEQRDLYRKELYSKLSLTYTELKKFGIKQLHFHFPDTTSFLRFHKPNKYGDNLRDIRYSLVLTNQNKVETRGFEEGRIFNGYRIVYPLIYKEKHIGSVEMSIGFNAIRQTSKEVYSTLLYMVLAKDVVKNKLFTNERKNYEQSVLNNDFYHEANSFLNYKNDLNNTNGALTFNSFHNINEYLKDEITTVELEKYEKFVKDFAIDGQYFSAYFLPIKNVQGSNIGYIISYEESKNYEQIIEKFYKDMFVTLFVLLIVFIFIYKADTTQQRINEISKKERDLAIESNRAKSLFLANMSHEIRTPLNAIVGFVDLLKDDNLGKTSMKYVEVIDKATKNLLQIIEDILDFSKIEQGKLEVEKLDFNPREEFESVTYLFSTKSSQKNIDLTVYFDPNIPKFIKTDPLRVKQVVLNLLSNAIKFTEVGKVEVSFTYIDRYLSVSVKDQGKGIAKEKLEHIFEAFNQEDISTTREFGGTGLGLSISYALVKLLGGELKVKSELGEGSEFYFSLPVELGKELEDKVNISNDIRFADKKVLLVEDNKSNQMYMKVLFQKLECSFDIANDGLEAIEFFNANSYDMILMDENMPNMSGTEAAKKILEIEKEKNLKHTPLIALTANAIKGDRERFLEIGMDEYLTKPLRKENLIKVLYQFLGNKDD